MKKKHVTVFDAGGGVFLLVFAGIPVVGSLLDWGWNWLVIFGTLWSYSKVSSHKILDCYVLPRIKSYSFFITIVGFGIDWIYFSIIWSIKQGRWMANMPLPLQSILIIVPLTLLFAANLYLSRRYLKSETAGVTGPVENYKQVSLILSVSMAVLTAPWLLVFLPYAAGWTH